MTVDSFTAAAVATFATDTAVEYRQATPSCA